MKFTLSVRSFHVPATHPQLEKGGAEVIMGKRDDAEFTHRYVNYEVYPHGHGRFFGGPKTPMAGHINERKGDPLEEMAARLSLLVDGMDAMVLKEDVEVLLTLRSKPIPEGSSLGGEYVKALYGTAAAQKRPMPKMVPEILEMWGGEVFVYPNLMILPMAGNAMIYRVRPDKSDPDKCTFEILSTKTLPAQSKPPRATLEQVLKAAASLPSGFGDQTLNAQTCETSPALPLDNSGVRFRNVLLGQAITLNLNVRLSADLVHMPLTNSATGNIFCTIGALPGPACP